MAFKTLTDGSNNFKFENIGDSLEGVYVSKGSVELEDKEVNTYQFNTTEGTKSILGTYNIDLTLSKVPLNTLIRITLTEQVKRKSGGGKVNVYKIECDDSTAVAS